MSDDDLYELYRAEKAAYYEYVSAERGDAARGKARPSLRVKRRAKAEWYLALARLTKAASREDIREMLRHRNEGKRKRVNRGN